MLKLLNFGGVFAIAYPKKCIEDSLHKWLGGMPFDSHDFWVVTSMHHDAASCFLFQIFGQLGNPFLTPEHRRG